MSELKPPPISDFGGGWAEIERTRFGYRITAGIGFGEYMRSWFRFRRKAARRKARRLVDQANREQQRYNERERLGYNGDFPEPDLSGGPITSQIPEDA